jgi:hypothetical protein
MQEYFVKKIDLSSIVKSTLRVEWVGNRKVVIILAVLCAVQTKLRLKHTKTTSLIKSLWASLN